MKRSGSNLSAGGFEVELEECGDMIREWGTNRQGPRGLCGGA